VLDGGASEVFLQGTRLASFMKSVEQVAGAIGVDESAGESDGPAPVDAPGASGQEVPALSEAAVPPQPVPAALPDDAPAPAEALALACDHSEDAVPDDDPWADLLQAGAAMLQGLAAQRQPGAEPPIRIERDPQTGQPSLRLPLPDPGLLQQLAKALAPWSKS
jgi:hypothetical protein